MTRSTLGPVVMAGAVVLVAALGCGLSENTSADTALRLDRDPVAYIEFEAYLTSNVDPAEVGGDTALGSAVLSRLLDQFVDERLLRRLATDDAQVEVTPEMGFATVLERLLAVRGLADVTDVEIDEYYRANLGSFEHPALVHLWQIMVPDRAMAEDVVRSLAAGESFRAAANRLAEDPDANFCGDQGMLAHEDLPPAFADQIFAMEPGQASDILTSDYGYYLFMVESKTPATLSPLQEVAGEIRERLRQRRLDDAMTEAIETARTRYNVRVFPTNLPFSYQGRYAQEPTD